MSFLPAGHHCMKSKTFKRFVADQLSHVGVDSFTYALIEKRFAVFRAENDVQEVDGKGLWHRVR